MLAITFSPKTINYNICKKWTKAPVTIETIQIMRVGVMNFFDRAHVIFEEETVSHNPE